MRRLPLRSIEAFAVAARTLNLARAAAEMSLTVPALSRRIGLLEAELGTKLFTRLPRGLGLTEAGAAYAARLAPAWDALHAATEAARAPRRNRPLKLSVMPSFAANWLVPRLARFSGEVEIETSPDCVDLAARPDLDCAIRLGCGPWAGLASQLILPVDAGPVASPGFQADHALREPHDLLRQRLIGTDHQPEFWTEWFAAAGLDFPKAGHRTFDNLHLVYEAAASGMGVALGLEPVVRPFLESGRLVRLFTAPLRLSRAFHLLRREGEEPCGGFGRFRDWLLAEAAA